LRRSRPAIGMAGPPWNGINSVRIVPVIDVFHDHAVRGVGGRRDEYRPIQSRLTASSDPVALAHAFRAQFGLSTLYLADLDAIVEGRPHFELYRTLANDGFELWVDAGITSLSVAEAVLETGVKTLIVGLESCPRPELLGELSERFGTDRLLFSLDLRDGVPMSPQGWPTRSPVEIAELVLSAGFRRVLVLDLTDVGCDTGGRSDALLRALRVRTEVVELVAGGGVRGPQDLLRLHEIGVDALLVASALHDGRLTRADVSAQLGTSLAASRPTRNAH
jgi:HisA/HisF family protein